MTTISTTSGLITLINVFTVELANQRRLIELLTEATEVSVRRAPGFVSASLHRSTDGTKVTMYAQWRSIEHYQAMRQDAGPLATRVDGQWLILDNRTLTLVRDTDVTRAIPEFLLDHEGVKRFNLASQNRRVSS